MSGAIAGTDVDQHVAGTTVGHFLWDQATGTLHSLEHHSDLSGMMQMTVAPVPLALRIRGTVRIQCVDPGKAPG